MAGNRYVPTIFTALDVNGEPIPGAKLYFYENETTTPKDTYSDIDLSVTNPWPMVADAAGRFSDDIFLDTDPYRIKLCDSSDVTIWDKDNCNTFNGAPTPSDFPKIGAVINFYGTQDQLDDFLASYWYIMDGNNGLDNLNGSYIKGCITVGALGGTGGTNSNITTTGTVGGHALTAAELAAHSHYSGLGLDNTNAVIYGNTTDDVPGPAVSLVDQSAAAPTYQAVTSEAGGGDEHTHTLTMDATNFQPKYYTMIPLIYLGV